MHTTTDAPLDTIWTGTTIYLSWGDRLRVLLGRRIHFEVAQDVWHAHVGDGRGLLTEITTERCWVEPVFRRRLRLDCASADMAPDSVE